MVDVFIAIAHLGGSVVVDMLVSTLLVFLSMKISKGHQERIKERVGLEFAAPFSQLDEAGWTDEMRAFYSKRYDNDLIANRLSDFFGLLTTFWGWTTLVIQILIWGATAWFTFSNDLSNAAFAWFIIAVVIISWLITELISFVCRLLTGRNPGEAKRMRKEVAKSLDIKAVSDR